MVARRPDASGFPGEPAEALLAEIGARLPPIHFETWFRSLAIDVVPPDRVVITAPNRFSRTWIDRKFREVIVDSARVVLGVPALVDIVVADPPPPPGVSASTSAENRPLASETAGTEGHPHRGGLRANGFHGQAEGARPELVLPSGRTFRFSDTPSGPGFVLLSPINRDHTFESFVIGPSNRLAHAASLGVAEAPGRTYNPLFIYGGVGLGKTHLLHAIVHRLRDLPRLNLSYFTSESFSNHFIKAIERGDVDRFRNCLRSTDVLIVDDVQFLSAKHQTQEEFFHTFNALIAEAKQVVISSDCPPREIPGLQERLVSRFKMGLVTRVEPPNLETRLAIVHKKAHGRGREVSDTVAEYLANHIVSNIRELEGALTRLFGLVSLQERPGDSPLPITLAMAEAALREIAQEENLQGTIGIPEIQKAVALFYDVKPSELASQHRARTISFARQVCMYLGRKLTQHSFTEIGRILGGRNHATVIYSVNKIDSLAGSDPRLQADLKAITGRILGSRSLL